jgi:hypothetical protein
MKHVRFYKVPVHYVASNKLMTTMKVCIWGYGV